MYQPDGFVDPQKLDYVCQLTKALYGLKKALRAWFDTFSSFLIKFGFTCSRSDPSLFTYHKGDKTLVLLLYVDDILLTGSDDAFLSELLSVLNQRFAMKDMGSPKQFLGIEMLQYTAGIFLHQRAYAEDVLHQVAMSDCNLCQPLCLSQ